MSITITLPSPWAVIGPGTFLQWTTTTALGTTPRWQIDVSFQSDFTNPYFHVLWTTSHQDGLLYIPFPNSVSDGPVLSSQVRFTQQRADGDPVYTRVRLLDNLTVTDTGTDATATWQNTANPYNFMEQMFESHPSSGGLTMDQAAELTTASDNSTSILTGITATITDATGAVEQTLGELFSQHTLDLLTLTNLTTGGPVGGTVTHDISGQWIYGVIVRISTEPPTLAHTTPDNQYVYPDLAVLQLIRGTDLVKRIPIHMSSHMEYPLPGMAITGINDLTLGLTPPWTSIRVDFATGVTGEVFLMALP